MNSHQLSYDDLVLAEEWLNDPSKINEQAVHTFRAVLIHLKTLMGKEQSRSDLVKYLRLQMGIDPKSEKLKDPPNSNQLPGSAIFRR
ncbi:MAG: hypothetical protein H7249_05955 [Chitinophagaceae bacterium]|nr:hypothetical protein [Oligoflexus sp.]